MAGALPASHLFLALVVVAVWGTNFVIIRLGLDYLPPLTFATLRFVFVAAPAVAFIARPAAPWRHMAAYGLLIGVGQFGLLFIAINGLISPGLASLVVQSQVFFTIGLSICLTGERVAPFQLVALALATSGIAVIAAHVDAATTLTGLLLTLAAAACWAMGNMVAKAAGRVDMVAYVAWSSLFAIPPLAALAFVFDGPQRIADSLAAAPWQAWVAVIWQSTANSLFGYAAWGWLLARNPAASVTPMAMLVPVFGIGSSAALLGEALPAWKLIAGGLVLGGLTIGLFWPRLARWLRRLGRE